MPTSPCFSFLGKTKIGKEPNQFVPTKSPRRYTHNDTEYFPDKRELGMKKNSETSQDEWQQEEHAKNIFLSCVQILETYTPLGIIHQRWHDEYVSYNVEQNIHVRWLVRIVFLYKKIVICQSLFSETFEYFMCDIFSSQSKSQSSG